MKMKYAAVIVATVVHFILGFLWYSPLLFGNKFLQIINWTPQQIEQMHAQESPKELIIAFITSLGFGLYTGALCSVHQSHQCARGNSNRVLVVAGFYCHDQYRCGVVRA